MARDGAMEEEVSGGLLLWLEMCTLVLVGSVVSAYFCVGNKLNKCSLFIYTGRAH